MSTEIKDVFGRKMVAPQKPISADMCTILWGPGADAVTTSNTKFEAVTGATNITISYQQQVIRRRTLGAEAGRPIAIIYPTQPIGSIVISRLFSEKNTDIFSYPGWNICNGTANLKITFDGSSAYADCAITYGGFNIFGATVTGYNISAEAEGLTIVDNISIEFLQMQQVLKRS